MSVLLLLGAFLAFAIIDGISQAALGVDHLPSIASRGGVTFWLLYLGIHPDMPEDVHYDVRMNRGRVELRIERVERVFTE